MDQVEKKKIFAIIEARMSSSRLPGKVLKSILGQPVLALMVERLSRATLLDETIIATTVNPADDPIEQLAQELHIPCFRGSEEDVLLRVVEAAEKYKVDIIVEVTGDCPLIDPAVVDKVVSVYLKNSYDYVSNCLKNTYPVGMDTQVFSTKKLREVERLTKDPVDREHVSLYFYEKPGRFSVYNVESGLSKKDSQIRLTLDTPEDLQLIQEIFIRLYPKKPAFSLEDILALLEARPELNKINRKIRQKKTR